MKNKKTIIAFLCVVAAAIIAAVGFLVAKNIKKHKSTSVVYSFSAGGFDEISAVKSLNGELGIYTDSKTGLKGIMDFTGKVTDPAQFKEFYVVNSEWQSYRYAALAPDSEYKRLVDTSTGVVTNRQYHDSLVPEKLPCWSEEAGFLLWKDEKGTGAQVKASELSLSGGLYPVCGVDDDKIKFGYINSLLELKTGMIYENALGFSEGLAAAKKDGKWGYINEKGVTVIPFEYDSVAVSEIVSDYAYGFSEGFAPVCRDGLYGVINNKGEITVDFIFDAVLPCKNGKFIACKSGTWGVITLSEMVRASVSVPETTTVVTLAGKYTVRTSGSPLNMRDAANTGGNIVAKIPNGSQVEIIENTKDWAKVSYGTVTGWVSMSYIVASNTGSNEAASISNGEPGKYKVSTSGNSLNMRATPDASSKVIEKIPNATLINVSEFENGWAKVLYNSAQGWVSAEYIVPAE